MFTIATVDCRDADAPRRFVASLRETGFAVLTGHPLETGLIDELYAEWAAFFADEDKAAWTRDVETQTGYFPLGSENARGRTVKDLKEFYHVYPQAALPPAVEAVTWRAYAALVDFGRVLLGWIDAGSPPEVRAAYSQPLVEMLAGSRQNLLRILHYPPLDEGIEPGAERAAAHADINLITLLLSGSEPGLEAQDRQGRWHAVPCDAGMITVNVGDMLQLASGGWFPSTLHRVHNPPLAENRSRYSMPMFLHPRPEVMLSPTVSAHDYLQERLREIGLKAC
ncbi:MAG: isopenicillin N synthase family oxygenase [Gammaproteobacteria bacterium]|nr:isopenicillin N synthase family oxygenase [Gammaproteobacteria bacterium]TVQ50604.1 MAG: isopenicillin N synthase family oxygenase [Gammaproteobacteria bacterium]